MSIFSWIGLILLLIIEGTMTSFPLVLIFLLCLMIMKRAEWVFLLALCVGVLLDIFLLRPIGITSVFFLLFVFLIQLYERKYEIATIPFVAGAAFIGGLVYTFIFGDVNLIESCLASVLAVTAFLVYTWLKKPAVPAHLDYQKV